MKSHEDAAATSLARRRFMRSLGLAAGCAGAAAASGLMLRDAAAVEMRPPQEPDIPGYDWTRHRWAFAVDATRCIGCLRCVEACKTENNVEQDASHFRTWVERYAYLDGETRPRIDSQSDPGNIAASGSGTHFRFDNRYKDAKVSKAFFVPKLCNHCENPACVQVCPTGATFKTLDGVVLIDHKYCIGCQYCVQACPYGARSFNHERHVSDKCTWCYHRITKGLNPACVDICPTGTRIFGDLRDPASPISQFLIKNRIEVLKPETGNRPNVYYVGIDEEVS